MMACRLRVQRMRLLFEVTISATTNPPLCKARYMLDCQDLT